MTPPSDSSPAATPTRAIVLLAIAGFVSSANLRVCDPLLPQIAGDFGTTAGGAGVIVTAFALSYGVFQIAAGPLGDARGKLRMVVLGCLWAGATTLASAAMPSLSTLILLRFLAGIGGAAILPLSVAWLGDVIPYERRQLILARFASGQILGVIFGQAAGGILGELVGWRGAMVVLGVAHIGAGLLLLAEMHKLTAGAPSPGPAPWRQSAMAARAIFGRRWARILLCTTFIEGLLMLGSFAYVGAHLHQRFDIGPGLIGLTIAAFGLGALAYVLAAGWLLARWKQSQLMGTGIVLLTIGYVLLAIAPWLWLAPLAVIVAGLGFYMVHNTLQTEATQLAPETRGLAMSMFAMTIFTGQAVGVALAGPTLDRWGGTTVFLVAAAGLLAVISWFRTQLMARSG